ncbi:MAG: hypothetical protein PHV39_05770 [Methanomicrobium sp.]|nr:hypothetical protein [Methanomicrobium sp.]
MSDYFSGTTEITCPVCETTDCIKDAEEIISSLNTIFTKCPGCSGTFHDRQKPPKPVIVKPCPDCGRRFIDDVIAHCYLILNEEGEIPKGLPLSKTGIPLVTPGFAMKSPPHLPKKSLVLQTLYAGEDSAKRILDEVPEVKGVIKDNRVVPGVTGLFTDLKESDAKYPEFFSNTLLAGCDVRCDIFYAGNAPFVVYKNQSMMHIEFPRGFDPKINTVCENVRKLIPQTFIDACCGAGTLGISAALFGVNSVVFNDIWYPAAFWTEVNLYANRKMLEIEKSEYYLWYNELRDAFGTAEPLKTAHFEGRHCSFDVFLGDFRKLSSVIPGEGTLTALDVFDKINRTSSDDAICEWKKRTGGDAFIP